MATATKRKQASKPKNARPEFREWNPLKERALFITVVERDGVPIDYLGEDAVSHDRAMNMASIYNSKAGPSHRAVVRGLDDRFAVVVLRDGVPTSVLAADTSLDKAVAMVERWNWMNEFGAHKAMVVPHNDNPSYRMAMNGGVQ